MICAIDLAGRVAALPRRQHRRIIALAGPPASGKSTFARELTAALGTRAELIPMDGFHLDNRILYRRGMLERKGAPESFDLGGLTRLVSALQSPDGVVFPVFDRERDISVAGAGEIRPDCDTVVIEGNYLMFDRPGWRELVANWDACLFLDASPEELRTRLIQRWLEHGLDRDEAKRRTETNDMPNALSVLSARLHPPVELTPDDSA